jgi:hypothetical protein
MRALVLAVLACALAGCGPRGAASLPEPPQSLEPGWRRALFERIPPSGAPEPVRSLGPSDALRAAYERGSARITVEAYLLPGEGAAFEARQKFRQQSGLLGFHNGRAFVTCASGDLDSAGLIAFSRALESAWFSRSP